MWLRRLLQRAPQNTAIKKVGHKLQRARRVLFLTAQRTVVDLFNNVGANHNFPHMLLRRRRHATLLCISSGLIQCKQHRLSPSFVLFSTGTRGPERHKHTTKQLRVSHTCRAAARGANRRSAARLIYSQTSQARKTPVGPPTNQMAALSLQCSCSPAWSRHSRVTSCHDSRELSGQSEPFWRT